jgi:hypothetical protein
MFREVGRRDTRFVFFSAGLGVGRGWKAFETDWPTFLKKSPTGSALTHGTLANNSAATSNQSQRGWLKNVIRSSAFNDEAGIFRKNRDLLEAKNLSARRFGRFYQNG